MWAPAQNTTLTTTLALFALLLASFGLYGVLSHAVTQCTNEIGVRMALGATSTKIYFGERGLALTLAGLVIGLAVAAIASRSMTNLLYGLQAPLRPEGDRGSWYLAGRGDHSLLWRGRGGARMAYYGSSDHSSQSRKAHENSLASRILGSQMLQLSALAAPGVAAGRAADLRRPVVRSLSTDS